MAESHFRCSSAAASRSTSSPWLSQTWNTNQLFPPSRTYMLWRTARRSRVRLHHSDTTSIKIIPVLILAAVPRSASVPQRCERRASEAAPLLQLRPRVTSAHPNTCRREMWFRCCCSFALNWHFTRTMFSKLFRGYWYLIAAVNIL